MRVHCLGSHYKVAEILAYRATGLPDPIIPWLKYERLTDDSGRQAIECRLGAEATIIESGEIPARSKRVCAESIIRVAQLASRPLRHLKERRNIRRRRRWERRRIEVCPGFANPVERRHRNPYKFNVRVAGEVFGPSCPLRNADEIEAGKQKLAHIAGRDYVGEEQANDLAPDNVLGAYTKIPVAGGEIEIVLPPDGTEALILLDRIGVEIGRKIDGVNVDPAANFPFHLVRQLALPGQLQSTDRTRPMRGRRVRISTQGVQETAEFEIRLVGLCHRLCRGRL